MDAFAYRSSQLFCEDASLASIADRFGTPTYVYSQARITGNLLSLARALAGVPSLICYSVKANSNRHILRLVREAGAGFDVVSGGELERVMRVEADPQRVVFSGVGKTQQEIDAGLAAGILMFNVESAGELELIEARARNLNRVAPISLRINPDIAAETHPYISTGRLIHKFGVPKREAASLYEQAAHSSFLRVRGMACHIGSQILEADPFVETLKQMLVLARELAGRDIHLQYLDAGGGFGVPYAGEEPLDLAALAGKLTAHLTGTPYQLILEPGRSIVGDAGILLTRVLYLKRSHAKTFVVADAGMNDLLRPALYNAYHEVVPVKQRAAPEILADVVGPLCETGDFLARDRRMPVVASGELLAVLTAGAYGYALASNYNSRPRPAEVLVNGERAELIRRRETIDDLMATETRFE